MKPLNIFYKEPDPDRWLPFDRYPRRLIRELYRGKPRPGGVMMIYLNLLRGLDELKIPYRNNEFGYARRHPGELACIIGKPKLLFKGKWKNPVLFGAGVFSHPIDYPDLFEKFPVQRVLVPGEWMRIMFEPYYGNKVLTWPVGTDTERWKPTGAPKTTDVLIYDKMLWNHDQREQDVIRPLKQVLRNKNISFEEIRYGSYLPGGLQEKLQRCKAAIFLGQHETQGLAYQQMLASGVPVFARDEGGYWLDPGYYPHRVQFKPVSSVPYWDERCGMKFTDLADFTATIDEFMDGVNAGVFKPRDYMLENLTLARCAQQYVDIVKSLGF